MTMKQFQPVPPVGNAWTVSEGVTAICVQTVLEGVAHVVGHVDAYFLTRLPFKQIKYRAEVLDMHSDIIDEILEVEDNAVAIVDNAEKEARDIIFKAQSEKRDMMMKAIEKQRVENDRLFSEAESLLKEKLANYEEERNNVVEDRNKVAEEALEGSVDRITALLLGV